VVTVILETTFLIDLERELQRREEGPAHRFLQAHDRERVCITWTIAGELAAGAGDHERARWEAVMAGFEVLPCGVEVAWAYARAYRHLRANGTLIGANDLWIAATARAHDQAVVTRNVRDYNRVPGVRVLAY